VAKWLVRVEHSQLATHGQEPAMAWIAGLIVASHVPAKVVRGANLRDESHWLASLQVHDYSPSAQVSIIAREALLSSRWGKKNVTSSRSLHTQSGAETPPGVVVSPSLKRVLVSVVGNV